MKGPCVVNAHYLTTVDGDFEKALQRGYRFVAFASEMLIFSNRLRDLSASMAALR